MSAPATSVLIRPAGPFDLEVLAGLHALCFPDEPWPAPDIGTLLAMPGSFGLIAVRETSPIPEPLGLVLCRVVLDEGEILTIAVAPSARRAGVGQVLLAAALAQVGRLGAVSLFLEVAEDNPAAQALYAAAGFVACGRRRRYYRRPNGEVDALVLRVNLAD